MKRAKVKYCGMKSKESAAYAIQLGVDYLGFVVDFNKSPRSISINNFLELVKWLKQNKKGKYKIVAVTIDMPLKNIGEIVKSGVVDVIQLHGNEKMEEIKKIRGIEVWKAMHHESEKEILKVARFVDRVLLDSGNAVEKANGSSGEFDGCDIYNKLKKSKVSVVVSGGINNSNVTKYLKKLKPEIIDVSRGIEIAPGRKSKRKMKEFMETVNDYYQA